MITDRGYARVPNGTGIMKYQNHSFDAPNSTYQPYYFLPTYIQQDNVDMWYTCYPNQYCSYYQKAGAYFFPNCTEYCSDYFDN